MKEGAEDFNTAERTLTDPRLLLPPEPPAELRPEAADDVELLTGVLPKRVARMPRPRPEVRFTTPTVPDDVISAFSQAAEELAPPLDVGLGNRNIDLLIRVEERHFWSPWLSLQVTRDGAVTSVAGRFGPHPHIWTGFVFLYALLGFGGLVGSMYGWAQIVLEQPPWAFAALPGAMGLIAFVYGAEFIGKGLAAEQMYVVRDFVWDAMRRVGGSPAP
jgi:hypothetical protein